jgi:hypothetical protein
LIPLAGPYKTFVMQPINKKLLEKEQNLAGTAITDMAAEAGIAQEETAHVLVDRWATRNLGRALITAICAISATWATLLSG